MEWEPKSRCRHSAVASAAVSGRIAPVRARPKRVSSARTERGSTMIATSVRASLTADDMRLAVELLGSSESERVRLSQKAMDEGPDALWDDPRLMGALLASRDLRRPSAALFYYVVLRRLLLELGVDDPAVTDYCATMVLTFGRGNRAYRISEHDENGYAYLVDLVEEADRADSERQFRVRVHVGNFSLWLTGIFPDYIAARRTRKGGPALGYYEAMGRTGFLMASDHQLAERYGLEALLRSVGHQFGVLRMALNRLSDRVMFPTASSPDRIMRQV